MHTIFVNQRSPADEIFFASYLDPILITVFYLLLVSGSLAEKLSQLKK